MKKKINLYMIAVAITAVLSTALLVSFVFNRIIRQQVLEDLRVSCRMIESVGKFDKLADLDSENLRITWIDDDGKVLFDSYADVGVMSGHKNRPEIINAFKMEKGMR